MPAQTNIQTNQFKLNVQGRGTEVMWQPIGHLMKGGKGVIMDQNPAAPATF